MKITEEALHESTRELFGSEPNNLEFLWNKIDTFLTNNTEDNALIRLLLCGTINHERLIGFIHGYLCYENMMKKHEMGILNNMLKK